MFSFTEKTYKIFRIVFCVLACLCVAATVVIGALFGFLWALVCIAGACVFGILMMLSKGRSEPKPPASPDFMNTDEENEAIRRAQPPHDGPQDGSDQ